MDILERIVADKRLEVAAAKVAVPEGALREAILTAPAPRSLKNALSASGHGIIAEFKRKSPSRGWIHASLEPEQVVPQYAAAGAAALSILTDGPYFGGSLDYIRRVRGLVDLPILRKDFVIDPYQLLEARSVGADAVLLIASCLTREECAVLLSEAHSLGLQVVLEIHTPEELDYISPDVDVVGVNNRHLGSFVTDVEVSFRLADALREKVAGQERSPLLISESGISEPQTLKELRSAGFSGFLMGERFMREPDPGKALQAFLDTL